MANLSIYYQNVRGLRTKTGNFYSNLLLNSYDILSITESWLTDSVLNSELFDSRYLVWRRDRDYLRTSQKYGGGVLLAVRRDLVVIERPDWRSSAEDIWVTITVKRANVDLKINLCTVYLCKEGCGNSYKVQLQSFANRLCELILSHPTDLFIVMGDFNFGADVFWGLDYETNEYLPFDYTAEYLMNFFDVLNTCNLKQFNGQYNINDRVLDLVFSNSPLSIKSCESPIVCEDQHHKSLCVEALFVEIHKLNQLCTKKYLYNRADYVNITKALSETDWMNSLKSCPLEEAVSVFYSKLYNLRDKYVPAKFG